MLSEIYSAPKSGFDYLLSRTSVTSSGLPVYTYVPMESSSRFSRTDAGSTSVDMSSKHPLHAGGKPEVIYAGDFWIEREQTADGSGEKVLFMDNNSGTFAPPGKDLVRMIALMEALTLEISDILAQS